jgi:hypothetical protein
MLWAVVAAGPTVANVEALLIERVRPGGTPVVVERGHSVLLEVSARLRELPDGDLDGRTSPLTRSAGLTLLEWTEEIEIRPGKNSSTVLTHAILRVDAQAPLGPTRVGARVEVLDRGKGRNIAVMALDTPVVVVEGRPTPQQVDAAASAYALHQARAEQGARLVPVPVKLERVELPPRGAALTGGDRLALKGFLASRLRADIARDHLRAAGVRTATDTVSRAVTERAVRALGALVDAPARLGAPRPPPLTDPSRAVDQGVVLFERLELELAERALSRARLSPTLPVARLPEALLYLGLIDAARGLDAEAAERIGQALCLRPTLTNPTPRPPMAQAFDDVKRRARCPRALAPHSLVASAVQTEDGPGVRVRALFAPDPFHVIDRGVIELLDGRDDVRATREVSAGRGDLAALEAEFGQGEVGAIVENSVRLRARALDVLGLELARHEAQAVSLVTEAAPDEGGVAWWVWLLGGVAVAAAGATTAVVLVNAAEPRERTIGPVGVTF